MLIKKLIEKAREMRLGNLWLMASKEGKALYKECGFDDERIGLDVYMEWYEGEQPASDA